MSLDDAFRVREQMSAYRRLGYPEKNGLAKGAFILRRHHDPTLRPIMETWFEQVLRYSKRDQLSLNPVMWSYDFEPCYVPLEFSDFELLEWPVIRGERLPRDFEDERYLRLNPDVSVEPRKHFLNEGLIQGRSYK
jgi:hypothetical protein